MSGLEVSVYDGEGVALAGERAAVEVKILERPLGVEAEGFWGLRAEDILIPLNSESCWLG